MSIDLQPNEVRQLLAFPKVISLSGVSACWGGWSAPAGPLPYPLQPCPLQTQRQLWPLHPLHTQKGSTKKQRFNCKFAVFRITHACPDWRVMRDFCLCHTQDMRKQRSGKSLNEDTKDESADKKRGIFFSWSRNRSFGKGPKKKDIGDINLG